MCELGSIYLIATQRFQEIYMVPVPVKKVSLFNYSFMLGIFLLENLVHFWPEVIQNASVRSQFSVNSKAAFAMETASTLQKMPKYYTLHGNTCTFYWNCFISCVS